MPTSCGASLVNVAPVLCRIRKAGRLQRGEGRAVRRPWDVRHGFCIVLSEYGFETQANEPPRGPGVSE